MSARSGSCGRNGNNPDGAASIPATRSALMTYYLAECAHDACVLAIDADNEPPRCPICGAVCNRSCLDAHVAEVHPETVERQP